MTKEQKFYKTLQDVFIGAKIEGEGGFVNLMRIKSNYYRKIEDILKKDIEEALKSHPKFRDELFDKLYSFFSRYFTESGSIYFNSTPFHNNIYEKVYTDEKDVILFWKTQMLYYVKTDRIFRSLPVEFDGFKFYFDASKIENKKANEKRSLIFEISKIREDGTIVFSVSYSEKGTKTKQDEILKAVKKKGIAIAEEQLERAFRVFEKQSEVDFFINKNAKAFLEEQFKLWSYQYFWEGAKEWGADRVNQLQILKDIAFKTIDFISQFEDELVRIWNKPKFVKNSNYVITLDRILSGRHSERSEESLKLIEKIIKNKGIAEQIKEWQELGIVDEKFNKKDIHETDLTGKHLSKKYEHLPIDTKYFKDLELEILGLFDDLDNQLDGWLIKSENYQALNTILPKFKEKVQAIYADPPYNTTATEIDYVNRYKDASWLSLLESRIALSRGLLQPDGLLCITIDHIELHNLRMLLGQLLDEENILGTVCIKNNPSGRSTVKGFSIANEYAIFVGKSEKSNVGNVPRTPEQLSQYKEVDEFGKYQWRNFLRVGGANDFRTARPRLHYPLVVGKGQARIPQMDWDSQSSTWIVKDKISPEEQIVWPVLSDGIEFTWRLGVDTLKNRLQDLRVRKSKNGSVLIEIKFRMGEENEGVLPKTVWDDKLFNATVYGTSLLRDLFGESQVFAFPKSLYAVEECLRVCNTGKEDFVVDFFAGSGTTAHAVIDLNRRDNGKRKYILVEMAEYFDSVLLPRIKKVISSDKWKNGKALKDGAGISYFLKYYELEQYEEALANCRYEDSDLFNSPSKTPYQEYVFMKDGKMLKALEIDYKKNRVKVDLSKLYPNVDIAETLSNLTGRWIKKLGADEVEFEGGTKINTKDLDYKFIKPLIWW